MATLKRGDREAIPALLSIAAVPQPFSPPVMDITLRHAALEILSGIESTPEDKFAIATALTKGIEQYRNVMPSSSASVYSEMKVAAATFKAKGKAAPRQANPADRAGVLLQMGKNMDRNRNTKAAIGYFRDVVKQFPGTEQAKEASERIEKLGGP